MKIIEGIKNIGNKIAKSQEKRKQKEDRTKLILGLSKLSHTALNEKKYITESNENFNINTNRKYKNYNYKNSEIAKNFGIVNEGIPILGMDGELEHYQTNNRDTLNARAKNYRINNDDITKEVPELLRLELDLGNEKELNVSIAEIIVDYYYSSDSRDTNSIEGKAYEIKLNLNERDIKLEEFQEHFPEYYKILRKNVIEVLANIKENKKIEEETRLKEKTLKENFNKEDYNKPSTKKKNRNNNSMI